MYELLLLEEYDIFSVILIAFSLFGIIFSLNGIYNCFRKNDKNKKD